MLGYLYADIDGAFGRFHDADRDLLGMLASQAAVALDNAQWSQGLEQKVAQRTEELQASNALIEQRAGELAIINSIQQGIAAELDFQAIVDLVGDKLREVFKTGDIGHSLVRSATDLMHYLYEYEHGKRMTTAPAPPSAGGIWQTLVRTRRRWSRTRCRSANAGRGDPGVRCEPVLRRRSRSSAATACWASIVLENYERENAFGESEVRLLTTVAASMGVALENARLFDETQRLLKETEQRNAELAVINSIQEGMAAELDFQAHRRPRRRQAARGVRDRRHGHPLVRPEDQPGALPVRVRARRAAGASAAAAAARRITFPKMARHPAARRRATPCGGRGVGIPRRCPAPTRACRRSTCPSSAATACSADRARELRTRERVRRGRRCACSRTVAASMGVALENARLFDETQRLLKETEQRAAELAVINSIQEGVAAELDFQAIVDLVGDKLREVFHTGDVGIRWYDPAAGLVHYPRTSYERGMGFRAAGRRESVARGQAMVETRKPLVVNNAAERRRSESRRCRAGPGNPSCIFAPILAGDRVLGSIVDVQLRARERLRRGRGTAALDGRREHGRRAGERAPVRRDAAAAQGDRAAQRRARGDQQHPGRAWRPSSTSRASIDLVGDKLREVFGNGDIGIAGTIRRRRSVHYPYDYEHGARSSSRLSAPRRGIGGCTC